MNCRPSFTSDLSTMERRFVNEMNDVGFGRFEFLRIEHGALVLNPWPNPVRGVKFGTGAQPIPSPPSGEFALKM